jgi:hypothetical protein
MAIFCQINYYENILDEKFYFVSIGDNFTVTRVVCFSLNSLKVLIPKLRNFSSIDSK